MTGRLLTDAGPNTDRWYAARRGRIGGSDIGAILGVSPYESPYSLWHQKRNDWRTEVTPSMAWGHYMETPILAWLTDRPGMPTITYAPGVFAHEERDWEAFSPDAIRADGVLVEIKCSMRGVGYGAPGTDEVPPHVRAQVQWGMDVMGLGMAQVVASIAGAPPETWWVEANRAEQELMRGTAAEFVASLVADVCPPLDDHVATLETVRRLHPDIVEGSEVELTAAQVAGFLSAHAGLVDAEAKKRLALTRMVEVMGDAQFAVFAGSRVARRQARNGGNPFIVNVFKEER